MIPSAMLRHLGELARSVSSPDALDRTFRHALAALHELVAYDLAALYELEGVSLVLRAAEGKFASRVKSHRIALERFPTVQRALTVRHPVVLAQHDHEGEEGDPYDGVLDLHPGHSCMVVPLYSPERPLGMITLDAVACGTFTEETVGICHLFSQLVSMAMMFAHRSVELEGARVLLEEQNRVLVNDAGSYDSRLPAARGERVTGDEVRRSSRQAGRGYRLVRRRPRRDRDRQGDRRPGDPRLESPAQ